MLPNYFSNKYPYTDFHELNLDWIINQFKEMSIQLEKFVSLNTIKYADPIQWDITRQYETNTIVIDPLTGTAYISVQPVPSGVALTNEDYWTVVFDLGEFVTKMAHNLANVVEPETTLTATVPSSYGDWIVWGDILYRNINPSGITAGDMYVIDSNIEAFSVESVVGHVGDLITTDKTNLVGAINELALEVLGKIGDLDDLETLDKTTLVNAINEVLEDANYLRYSISPYTDIKNPTTIAIPKNTLFWINKHTLCESITDINVGDQLVETVNYYPATLQSLFNNIINFNNVVASGDVTIEGALTVNNDVDIVGNLDLSGSGVLSLPYHANVDDFLTKIQSFNHLLIAEPIYIFIGDSYDSYSDWVEKTANAMGLLSTQVVNLAQDSSNIASGGWLSFLKTWCTNNPGLLNNVVAVVGGGGINDSSDTWLPSLDGAIASLSSYVLSTLPNARLYLAYFGWALSTSPILDGRDWFRRSVAQMIYSRCGAHGAVYLSGTESILHDKTLLGSDYLHPNSAGGTRIASYLSDALRSGSCNVSCSPTNAQCDPADTNATLTGYVQESLFNNMYYLHIQELAITGAVNQIIVGTGLQTNILMNLNLLYADHIPDQDCTVTFVNANDQSEVTISGRLMFQPNGYLQFAHDATIATSFYASEVKAINLNIMIPSIQT